MCGHPLNRLDSSSETLYIYLTTLSVTDTVTSNEWMAVNSELESTCKWLWLAARFCPCHCLEQLGKTQNPRICGSRCRGRVLNQAELELKKVKISLIMPCRHIGGVEDQLYPFVTSTVDGGEWLTSLCLRKEFL